MTAEQLEIIKSCVHVTRLALGAQQIAFGALFIAVVGGETGFIFAEGMPTAIRMVLLDNMEKALQKARQDFLAN